MNHLLKYNFVKDANDSDSSGLFYPESGNLTFILCDKFAPNTKNGMESEKDDYSCELYTTAATDYKAIKESLHIDYDALWKEAEEIQTIEKLKPDDCKLKSKMGTKGCKGKRKPELTDTELSENFTSEELPNWVFSTTEDLCNKAKSCHEGIRSTAKAEKCYWSYCCY